MSVKSLFFTREALNNIKIPTEKQNIYRDTKEKGLFLIVSYGGSKTFYLGKKIQQLYQKIKIGRFPELSITEARTRASELKGEIAKGYNPAEERARLSKEPTFKEFYDKYLNEYSKTKEPSAIS
ncbi:Arm DNA-binding domain-containing protein [Rickettsia endosymbiont of Ixodes scapularis]|uniref:Arm DNA-binding domain-containing protein n=1 Tax=Rickettsia endosymbiont of Ixodes scapularis TaxID=444612 RepID=UPI0001A6058C|nr:Arm DNA-binding domain-containing protein [Rickettsia endosymbiont of Ixodes scapularis]EER22373.1 integrase [Rickettsia endosymbiont of Ixodes scapularis]